MIQLALIALLAQNASSSIQGVVLNAGTSVPLSKAIVEILGDDNSAPPLHTTTTEGNGRFLIPNVRPGRYRLVASRPGYVRRTLSVAVSQGRTEEVQALLTPTAAISGRVTGVNGEPMGNVDVDALRASYQDGRRVLTAVQSAHTDDRGEYRLFWLPPGRYYVSATHSDAKSMVHRMIASGLTISVGGGPRQFNMVRSTGDPAVAGSIFGPGVEEQQSERYVTVYFPGTISEQTASPIDVRAGADVGGVDMQLAPGRARHVRGVVINGATGQVAQYAGLRVIGAAALPGRLGMTGSGQAEINRDGSFDLTLLPGPYTFVGTAGNGVGYVSLEIGDAEVDGVQVVALPEFNVNGRLVSDGGDNADLLDLRISLRRDLGIQVTESPASSLYSNPRADGTFVVDATPGDYRVSVSPILNLNPAPPSFTVPPSLRNAYIKSIRLGNVDVLNSGVHLERPPSDFLEIVIGTRPGTVEGTVVTEQQSAAAGATVVLLPDFRRRTELYKTITTDASGRFHMDRVPPGDYRLFAWDDIEEGAWQDPDVMRAYESRGTSVRVRDGNDENVQLTVIAGR
jgi:hypothetical protein